MFVAYTLSRLTRSAKEQLMPCSPQNVAMAVIVQSTAALLGKISSHIWNGARVLFLSLYIYMCIVHVESEGAVDGWCLCGRVPTDHYHNKKTRCGGNFLGQRRFGVWGRLAGEGWVHLNSKVCKKYEEQREELTTTIMQNVRVVFVTTALLEVHS